MSAHKLRLIVMIAASAIAFVMGGCFLVASAITQLPWMMPAFTAAIATGVGVQIWFIVASLQSMTPQGKA